MSRRRHVRVLRWRDEQGNVHTDRQVLKGIGEVAGVPRAARLVDVCCPEGHLVAVLGSGAPLVYMGGHLGPTPAFILSPGGLLAALVSVDPDGAYRAGGIGTPRASFPVSCGQCRDEWPLEASVLEAAGGRARPGRPSRVNLSRR